MRVLQRLKQHCADGALTLKEFSSRADRALRAAGWPELDELVGDLPERQDDQRSDRNVRRVVAILGSNRRRARWRVPARVAGVAIAGASWLDLRGASLGEGELTARAVALFGTVKVIVPEGIGVELTGLILAGAKTDQAAPARGVPEAPVVRVKGFALFGSIRVLNRPPAEPPPGRIIG